jgi:hypothetical protein
MLAHFGCVVGNVNFTCACGYATKYVKTTPIEIKDKK